MSATYIKMSAEEQDRLDAEALEWSDKNPVRDIEARVLRRFAGIASWLHRNRDGVAVDIRERVIHVAALDGRDARKRIKAVAEAIYPAAELEIYNVYSDRACPSFVLRGQLGTAKDHVAIDDDAVWLFPPWSGYSAQYQRERVQP